MTLDVLATEGHFAAHLAPVWSALPDPHRGRFFTTEPVAPAGDAVLVASYGDHKRARAAGYRRIARMEHGVGQSYAGDPATADRANYAGGRDADDVSLFLVPGAHPATRWHDAYPSARVEVVGSPRLDDLPGRAPGPTVVALSFHYNAYLGCPEGDSAWRWYRQLLPVLAKRFPLLGHAHPRWASRIRPWFLRAGAEFTDSFEDVCRRADVYACDNSSTIFEFAATGRPVVLLDAPAYRRDVVHGLRFWSAAHVGVSASPATIIPAIERALADDEDEQAARAHALTLVYGHRTGGAERAAAALVDWERAA